ncbi:hypothetical protein GAGA_4920 [Paraglaciecola agarilytica NO2]|uniref:Uncharacterized protein n=1 Tax=Paraglaciecola agarilytica NO2 TaxID=1125747 RepID=A0ABQ0IEN2_9ALTE|nr:hypothetical protein GAGA_4920 [Paraglaciecola agarilytica NO2]
MLAATAANYQYFHEIRFSIGLTNGLFIKTPLSKAAFLGANR